MSAVTGGLSARDLDSIRATLGAGRKPKVEFTASAGQIAGEFGQVVELLNPSDEEWIVVKFGRDELPFSATDLAIPARGATKRAPKAAAKVDEAPDPAPTDSYPSYEEIAAPRREDTMPATPKEPTIPAQSVGEDKPARKPPRVAKPKPLPSLTVTIAYTDGDWTVAAQQGSKALARPYIIKAAEALALVGMLDVPGVQEAVEQIVESERAQTQAHVERLRAELAEIEARLADYPKGQ
jgi:Family of unknown function (DUF6319)